VGSSGFSTEDGKKGALAPGQLADLAILSADYFSIPDEEIKQLESVLTVVGRSFMPPKNSQNSRPQPYP
jgi:predicted amidohydrolase YtcJ